MAMWQKIGKYNIYNNIVLYCPTPNVSFWPISTDIDICGSGIHIMANLYCDFLTDKKIIIDVTNFEV